MKKRMRHPRIALLIPLCISLCACSFTEVQSEDEALYDQGMKLYEEGSYREAANCFLAAADLSWSGRIDRSRYRAGKSYWALAERNDSLFEIASIDSAITQFEQVTPSSENGVDAWYGRAALHYLKAKIADSLGVETAQRSYEKAFNLARSLSEQWPRSDRTGESLLIQGNIFRKFENFTSSIECYERIIENHCSSKAYDNALYRAGDWYWEYRMERSKKMKALTYFRKYAAIKKEQEDTLSLKYQRVQAILAAEDE